MTDIAVRRGRVEDAAGVALTHVRSWQEAYRGLIEQDYLDRLDPNARTPGIRDMLRHEPWPDGGTLVAERGGAVVGFVNFQPAPGADAGAAEIRTMYVRPACWRTGVGRALMGSAITTMVDAGYASALLWALTAADGTHAFYRATGWRSDGGRRVFPVGGRDYPVIRFRRRLDVPLAA